MEGVNIEIVIVIGILNHYQKHLIRNELITTIVLTVNHNHQKSTQLSTNTIRLIEKVINIK